MIPFDVTDAEMENIIQQIETGKIQSGEAELLSLLDNICIGVAVSKDGIKWVKAGKLDLGALHTPVSLFC